MKGSARSRFEAIARYIILIGEEDDILEGLLRLPWRARLRDPSELRGLLDEGIELLRPSSLDELEEMLTNLDESKTYILNVTGLLVLGQSDRFEKLLQGFLASGQKRYLALSIEYPHLWRTLQAIYYHLKNTTT